eukprot:4080390-Pyramimonas_sp.AAC.1
MGHVCGAVRACRSGMRNTIGEHLWIPGRKAHAKGQARYVVAHLLLSGKASELSVGLGVGHKTNKHKRNADIQVTAASLSLDY